MAAMAGTPLAYAIGAKHYATEVVLRPFNSELLLLDKAERPAAQPAQRRERGAEPSGRR
jgi:hypothetical protein